MTQGLILQLHLLVMKVVRKVTVAVFLFHFFIYLILFNCKIKMIYRQSAFVMCRFG